MINAMDEDTSGRQLQELLHRTMSFGPASQEGADGPGQPALVARLERMHHQAVAVNDHQVADAVQALLDDLSGALDKLAAAQDQLVAAEAAAAAALAKWLPRTER